MPNIRELNSPNAQNGLRPSEAGPTALREQGTAERSNAEQIGRSLGSPVAAVGGFLDRREALQTEQEDAQLTTALAAFEYNQTDEWTKTAQGDSVPDLQSRQDYLDKFSAGLDEIGSTLTTPKAKLRFATERSRLLLSAQKQTAGDIATRAADQATTNIQNYVNTKVGTLSKDPTRLDDSLAAVDRDLPTLIPAGAKGAGYDKLITEDGQKMKEAMVKQSLSTMARNNPTAFMKAWNGGDFDKYLGFLTPSDQASLPNLASQTDKANQRTANSQTAAEQKAQRAAVDGAAVKLYASLYNDDGSINSAAIAQAHQSVVKDFTNMPGFTKADMNEMQDYINKVESGATKANKDDKEVVSSFEAQIATSGDPRLKADIYKAEADGHLTPTTRAALTGEFEALHPTKNAPNPLEDPIVKQQFEDGLKRMDLEGSAANGWVDPKGKAVKDADAAKYNSTYAAEYRSWYLSSFAFGLKHGKTPEQMTDPNSPDAIFKHWPGMDPYGKLLAPKYTPYDFNAPTPASSVTPAAPGASAPAKPALSQDQVNKMLFGG